MSNCNLALSKGSNPHSYAEFFSESGLDTAATNGASIKIIPKLSANPKKTTSGKYSTKYPVIRTPYLALSYITKKQINIHKKKNIFVTNSLTQSSSNNRGN